MRPEILVLGGYGLAGKPIARLLVYNTNASLKIAGRSIEKARSFAAELNEETGNDRVNGVFCDASDAPSLKRALENVDLLVVASSTAEYTDTVIGVLLETGVDYLDILYSTNKVAVLKNRAKDIEKAGLCFITDGGFHPGLPAALVSYVAQYFDQLERAVMGSVIKLNFKEMAFTDSTAREFIREINDFEPLIYKENEWKRLKTYGMTGYIRMDFGNEFGRQYCVPMFLEEMRSLPQIYPSLKETGFFVGGFNWFVDWLVLPIASLTLRIWPKAA